MGRRPWPKPMGVWLAGLVLVLRGFGAAAVHAWSASPAAQQDVARLAPLAPAAVPDPATPAQPVKARREAEPASLGQDSTAATQRALKESFLEPDPTSLGIVDYFGTHRVSQERVKALASAKRFLVPWWGWLIFAGILVLLTAVSFGLGAMYTKQRMKAAEEPPEVPASSGISRLATVSSRLRRSSETSTNTRASSKESTWSKEGPRQTSKERPLPVLEDFLPGGGARASAGLPSQVSGGGCLPCLPQHCGNLFSKAVKKAIAAVDTKVIGVALHVGNVRVDVRSGLIEIDDLVLDNPEGYSSEYLLRIERLSVQVSMAKYIFSRGKSVVLENLAVMNVEVIYEKALTTSNVDYVLSFSNDRSGKGQPKRTTLTASLLGTIAAGTALAASTAGTAAEALVGEDTIQNSMKFDGGSEETIGGRVAGMARRTVGGTACDVMDRAMSIAGTTAVLSTSAVALAAETLESNVTAVAEGAVSGVQSIKRNTTMALSSAVGAVAGGDAIVEEEEKEAPPPAEKPKEPSDETTFAVRRLAISNVGVTLASSMMGGRGVRLVCTDIEYQDFTGEVDISGGMDIVRFLLKTTLLTSVKSLSSVGEFTLDTAGRCMDLGLSVAQEVAGGAKRASALV